MAIFARRRLQTMFDELVPLRDKEQSRGLVRRMESNEIEQAPFGTPAVDRRWSEGRPHKLY